MAERLTAARARRWLRALHRDAGYLAVGMTIIYAVSGLAVNHIGEWDPNFTEVEQSMSLAGVAHLDPDARDQAILRALGVEGELDERYDEGEGEVALRAGEDVVHVNEAAGTARLEARRARPLLRVANWLHLNRGKAAWTYFADAYAVGLLFLALSGLFMIPARSGLLGRRGLLVGLGVALPVLYVTLSGGP
ncbi:MAG: PepSY-associated TM helix domain-containing protein [Sandaracinaceae bacterium]|nr:PepSY-associated TM helix domain-containing protein [Sandaracinaceae bacterium]